MPDFSLVHQTRPATEGEGPYPGLLLLHGLGSNEMDLHMMATQLDPRIYALSARAPDTYPWGGYMWYDLAEGPGLGGAGIERSLALLDDFTIELLEAYPIDRARLFVGGFSMGAAMADALALRRPDRIAGAVILSGYLPPPTPGHGYSTDGAAGHPFFQAHGTMDGVVPVDYGRQTRDFLREAEVDLTYQEYPIGHEVSFEELSDLAGWLDARLAGKPDSVSP